MFESDVRLLHFVILVVWRKMLGGVGFMISNIPRRKSGVCPWICCPQ